MKPNVSAGARDTGRFGADAHDAARALIERIVAGGRVALVQRYMPAVEHDGETALVFIGGVFSHALRKRAILRADEIAPTIDDELGVATAMRAPDLVGPARASPAQRAFAERRARGGGAPFRHAVVRARRSARRRARLAAAARAGGGGAHPVPRTLKRRLRAPGGVRAGELRRPCGAPACRPAAQHRAPADRPLCHWYHRPASGAEKRAFAEGGLSNGRADP